VFAFSPALRRSDVKQRTRPRSAPRCWTTLSGARTSARTQRVPRFSPTAAPRKFTTCSATRSTLGARRRRRRRRVLPGTAAAFTSHARAASTSRWIPSPLRRSQLLSGASTRRALAQRRRRAWQAGLSPLAAATPHGRWRHPPRQRRAAPCRPHARRSGHRSSRSRSRGLHLLLLGRSVAA
jgi:hypothetical protein